MTAIRSLRDHESISVVPGWMPMFDNGCVRRQIVDCDVTTKLQLLRRSQARKEPLENFWKIGKKLIEENSSAVDMREPA